MSDTRSPGHLDRCTNVIDGVPCEGRYDVTSRREGRLFTTQYISCPVCGDKPLVNKRTIETAKVQRRKPRRPWWGKLIS